MREHIPNLCDEVLNSVPCQAAVSYTSPPTEFVRRQDVSVCVEMVRHWDLAILPRRCDETNSEVGGVRRRCRCHEGAR